MWQRLNHCFSMPHARLGWILILIGLPAWFLFGQHADWNSVRFHFSSTRQTNGVVIKATPSGYTSGDGFPGDPISSVRFSFKDPNGILRRATSWTENRTQPRGSVVKVEFIESDPSVARIRSHRSGMLPLWAASAILFLLYGVGCILKAFLLVPRAESVGQFRRKPTAK
jgi:hypothetical protein